MTARGVSTAPVESAATLDECVSDFGTRLVGPVSLTVGWGETVALMGPSGSGKSTVLRWLRGDTVPTRGRVCVSGIELGRLPETERAKSVREHLSGVDQSPLLLPELDVPENVSLPLMLDGMTLSQASQRAHEALASVGLAAFGDRDLRALSGGECQRVAIARAAQGAGAGR